MPIRGQIEGRGDHFIAVVPPFSFGTKDDNMELKEAMQRLQETEAALEGALTKVAELEMLIDEIYVFPGIPEELKQLLRPDDDMN
jgi:hypothetical protein